MAKAKYETEVDVSKDAFYKAITDYERYPGRVEGVKRIEVISRQGNRVRAKYFMNLMKEIEYVIDHIEDEKAGTLRWELVESSFMKLNRGSWTLEALEDELTRVEYDVEVEFTFPAPGFIVNQLIKASLPKMVKTFAKAAVA